MQIFEFDQRKSQSNKNKHGIDFEEAQAIWADQHLLEVQAISEDEARFLVIGKIGKKHWSAIITYRDNTIRIISVRRSRKAEVAIYEG